MPRPETGRMENAWAIHQIETTVDFARRSRVASWLLGGLNFQIEHHLFPRICHVNYPAISTLVEQTCHVGAASERDADTRDEQRVKVKLAGRVVEFAGDPDDHYFRSLAQFNAIAPCSAAVMTR